MILIYDAKLRDRISQVGNLFDRVRPWFMDERNVPSDTHGRAIDIQQIIQGYRGRFPRLRGFLRDMAASGAVSQ